MPELTEYLYDSTADFERALEQHDLFESELEAWSREFPETMFLYMQADCAGGKCLYSGLVLRDGVVIQDSKPSDQAHIQLLKHVGIVTDDFFEPFTRGYFAG
jgi:hypothetical protein